MRPWHVLLALLFGVEFVAVPFAYDTMIRRIRRGPNGLRYIKLYGSFYELKDNGTCEQMVPYKEPKPYKQLS
jgi:hypothetical protein